MKKILLTFLTLISTADFMYAQWTTNTAVNTAIGYANNSLTPESASTSDGKTFIAYYNNTSGNYNMYLQLLDINGSKLFGAGGMLVSNLTSGSAIYKFHMAVDHADNAIIAFQYQPLAMEAIAFKVDTAGNQLWGSTGIDLGPGLAPAVGVLPSNDVVFAWNSSGIQYRKYSAGGTPQWASVLTVTSPTAHTVSNPQIVPMSNNHFILLFTAQPGSSFTTVNHYAQQYDLNGASVWTNATELSPATAGVFNLLSWVPDGHDGCYVSFAGGFTPSSDDVISQHLLANGTLGWGTNGVDVSGSANLEFENYIAHDLTTKTTWILERETNSAQSQSGLFIQKFDSSGNKLLGANALTLFPVSAAMYYPAGLQLMNGEPVFVFYDNSNQYDAMKLDVSGTAAWTPSTTHVCSLGDVKSHPHLLGFLNNQVVHVWQDSRGGNTGVYAQNILSDGTIGPLAIIENNSAASTISLYPNPSENRFIVSGLQFTGESTLEVFNSIGEKIFTESLVADQKEIAVNTNYFAPGIYYVSISSGNFRFTSKVVSK
ncbi:MAG: T9SS type A sorting domain-containing protein [Bacteroidetes bacterium]|nr:T9SS type A sorting domain-containing protein [Bacteroidota bacterium]